MQKTIVEVSPPFFQMLLWLNLIITDILTWNGRMGNYNPLLKT